MRKTTLALTLGALLAAGTPPAGAADLWDIYQLALKNDPTFQQAQANYQATADNEAIARSGYLPNITLSGRRSLTRTSGEEPQFTGKTLEPFNVSTRDWGTTYSATLTQAIFDYGAWHAIDQADAQAAQADAQFTAAQEDLILRTATAYFNVLNARDTLVADRAAAEANSKQLEQAKEKYEVGMSAITDVENAQAAYDQSAANEISAQQQVITAEEQLRAIIGQPAGELMEPSADMPLRAPNPGDAQQWVDMATKQNPSVLAAQSGADAASANIGVQRGAELPTLSLGLQHNKNIDSETGNESGVGIDPKTGNPVPFTAAINAPSNINTNIAYLQLSWPIFNGGGAWSRVSQAQAQYSAAQANVNLVTRQTEQQARTAYLGVLTGISQVTALRQSVKSNQTSMDATQTGMEVGTRTIVDVLTARQNLLTAETSFSNARYTYLESLMQLKQAAGTLNEDDVKQINTLMQVRTPPADMNTPGTSTEMGAPNAGTLAPPAASTGMPPASVAMPVPGSSTRTPPASSAPPPH